MREFSSGTVTWVSTSSGESPGASMRIVTVGFVRSGRTSTGSSVAVRKPSTIKRMEMATTIARFARDHLMSLLSIGEEKGADQAASRRV